ncbi:M23 family metallopeptidase [Candidatus Peregrinibacteria bacterium]|nr:M23 family metallopeptidase [Candidatus Peregrinibacteria bacterium]
MFESDYKWSSESDVSPPIRGEDLPDFEGWVNFNGFSSRHPAYDYAAYLTDGGKCCVLGLPEGTPVRAVADGTVYQVILDAPPYMRIINIEHGEVGTGVISSYGHVVPSVSYRQKVTRGDVIGTLYKDPGNKRGRLVHLHFRMYHAWGSVRCGVNRPADPALVFSRLDSFNAEPQSEPSFRITELGDDVSIRIANFEELELFK